MSVITARIVKISHIKSKIYTIFLKKGHETNFKVLGKF